jgi:hypothetical protein
MHEVNSPAHGAAFTAPERGEIDALIAAAKRERALAVRAFAEQALGRLRLTVISLFAPLAGWQRYHPTARPASAIAARRLPRSA